MSDNTPTGAELVRRLRDSSGGHINGLYDRVAADEIELLRAALNDLEVCSNTVYACYTRNPGNFAAALRDLRESAERARAALAGAQP